MNARVSVEAPERKKKVSRKAPPPAVAAEPGRPWPLGMQLQADGVNFAIWSGSAEGVDLCIFDDGGTVEVSRLPLRHKTDGVWHGFFRGVKAGTKYGVRVHGPYAPEVGLRHNPNQLLLDPYARAIDRPLRGAAVQYAYTLDDENQDLAMDTNDTGTAAVKGVVVDSAFDWGADQPPCIAWADTVFYEVNVRGFTMQHPDIPEPLRGTFAGLGSPPAIAHLRQLGVTAVELLPVQAFGDDTRLTDLGLSNYWGYNTIAFFAPEPRYAGGDAANEFRAMVKALHAAGIEVILDVVYNHTSEGNHLGPTVSFKGIDNGNYYRLEEDRRFYTDFTGTGNTLDVSNPPVLRLVMDSLRYWVEEMHVDGFRFDLAPAIARDAKGAFDHRAPFLAAVAQDPVLRKVKLIAEPWDLAENGYQVGGFPPGWAEWNGGYRDAVRDFWRGADSSLPALAARLCGSADLFQTSGRGPAASVNMVTVHDGFTLADLVGYNDKHNEANGEENRDGESHNRSWNCGAEGDTADAAVLALRARQKRNLLTTLFLSRGTPLLLGGDELGRTQNGNNNAYCQDNPLSWLDWGVSGPDRTFGAFVARLLQLRRQLIVLRRDAWPTEEEGGLRAAWYSVWGKSMTQEEWDDPASRCVAALFSGTEDSRGRAAQQRVLLLLNASPNPATFTWPEACATEPEWHLAMDTANEAPQERRLAVDQPLVLEAHSMVVVANMPFSVN